MAVTLTDPERRAIRATAELLAEQPGMLMRSFYARFFERHPETRELFGTHNQADQSRMLHETLINALDMLDDARWLNSTLEALGHRHAAYEVTDEMYDWFSACLIETFAELMAQDWTAEHASAWHKVLAHLCALMRNAGRA